MALGNQKLEPIKHEKARLATFKKRKASLVKKANEFSTLCDVDACMIIFGPKHKDQPVKPETWASEEGKLTTIINKYRKSRGKGDHQHQRMKVENKKSKVKDEAVPVCKSKRILEYATWDQRLESFSEDQLKQIIGRVDTKLEAAGKKLEMMKADTKAASSEHLLLSHNLSNQNVNSRQQGQRRRKSLDSQQASNLRENSQLHEMPASHSSFIQTPLWMRLNGSILYHSSGPCSSRIPFAPLQGTAHRASLPSCHAPISRKTLPLPLPTRASASSEKNTARLNEFRDFLQLKPPGDDNERP